MTMEMGSWSSMPNQAMLTYMIHLCIFGESPLNASKDSQHTRLDNGVMVMGQEISHLVKLLYI